MGIILATCGHEISGAWADDPRSSIAIADQALDYDAECFVPAVSHMVVCEACRARYERKGLILDDAQQEALLRGKP